MAIPFVFTDRTDNLVQISLGKSVGRGGHNQRDDVIVIQGLLNMVEPFRGGPNAQLATDGVVGDKTIAAITRFQSMNGLITDGRIDPGKKTICSLVPLLRDQNKLLGRVPGISRPDQRILTALSGHETVGATPVPSMFEATPWKFTGSSGASISVSNFGIAGGTMYLCKVADENSKGRLAFDGVTVGISKTPASLSASAPFFPSAGRTIRRGIVKHPETFDSLKDFEGVCQILELSASAGIGASVSIIVFGKAALVAGLFASKAWGILWGMQGGTLDYGISLMVGYARIDSYG